MEGFLRPGPLAAAVAQYYRACAGWRWVLALGCEFEALGVDLVELDQAIDTTTPAGRLLFHVLGAIAEFERDPIRA